MSEAPSRLALADAAHRCDGLQALAAGLGPASFPGVDTLAGRADEQSIVGGRQPGSLAVAGQSAGPEAEVAIGLVACLGSRRGAGRSQVNDGLVLRGTVDSDPDEDHRVPMVVIDGRAISWDEFGRMVATFEGWQFRLEFRDRSEEV